MAHLTEGKGRGGLRLVRGQGAEGGGACGRGCHSAAEAEEEKKASLPMLLVEARSPYGAAKKWGGG